MVLPYGRDALVGCAGARRPTWRRRPRRRRRTRAARPARRRPRGWWRRPAARPAPARRSRRRCRPSRPRAAWSDSRMTLNIRSVPMLPDPMIATGVVIRLLPSSKTAVSSPSPEIRARKAPGPVTGTIGPSAPDSTTSPARSGLPLPAERAGQPDDGGDRAAEAGRAGAGRDDVAALFQHHPARRRGRRRRARRGAVPSTKAPLEALSAMVSAIVMSQPAIRESTISMAGEHVVGGPDHVGRRSARVGRGRGRARRRSRPRPAAGGTATSGIGSRSAYGHVDPNSTPKSGLTTPQLGLHGPRGQADLAAHDPLAAGQPTVGEHRLHGVRLVLVMVADEVPDRGTRHPGLGGGRPAAARRRRRAPS